MTTVGPQKLGLAKKKTLGRTGQVTTTITTNGAIVDANNKE
jgi:hypothetical protein